MGAGVDRGDARAARARYHVVGNDRDVEGERFLLLAQADGLLFLLARLAPGAALPGPLQQPQRFLDEPFGRHGIEDEANLARGQVSWISPIARALRRAREGDIVELRTPAGPQRLEVLAISYPEIPDSA